MSELVTLCLIRTHSRREKLRFFIVDDKQRIVRDRMMNYRFSNTIYVSITAYPYHQLRFTEEKI